MTEVEKEAYVSKHLQHELRLLLFAVEMWRILKEKDSGFIVNLARDSVCVHFRTLLTFFINSKDKNDISVTTFGISAYTSSYSQWLGKINEAVLHISPARHAPKDKPKGDLNKQMDNFRVEILRLWALFTQDSPQYSSILCQALNQSNKAVCDDINKFTEILK